MPKILTTTKAHRGHFMIFKTFKPASAASALVLASTLALPALAHGKADWSVNPDNSSVNFVSIKNSSVGEVHHFKTLQGSLKDGQLLVNIDLASVETGIEIRNTRMQDYLFETGQFATATITANVRHIDYNHLKVGQSLRSNVSFAITLHGKKVILNTDVAITQQADNTLNVITEKPIMLHAKDFGLEGGIAKLIELAGLKAIASSVPVTAILNLKKIPSNNNKKAL